MNVKLLRAEWRAIRKASLRLMHNSLSLVGLLSVGIAAVVASHPEYAHAVGRWIAPAAPQSDATPQPVAQTEALIGAIAHPGGEAGRMLGLIVPDEAIVPADAVTLNKASVSPTRPDARARLSREQRDATSYLSKKYRVNSAAVAMLVDAAARGRPTDCCGFRRTDPRAVG